ncbi:hypothetical protein OZX69_07060 [Lactobacillus sp. ESL0731]|uniref:hypothetical protein n=1 Tax=unclassified Lactobacillus TaxID=2620435 RepID=UPI0023F73B0F|nr:MULTISPECIES: hypothetical protein [unclassified Lactobacillus]WEV50705.1 hypothetical protein OZX63_07055 [Lactobacillus sp. ESL0700]WEV61835.1 hypothetical protein OZX69_07060 [Lactobacillus sp. ESL0731]
MDNINDPHQFCEIYDDNDILICRWTMDKIERQDATVWVMNHFFINPATDSKQILAEQMASVLEIAQESQLPIWPLDPLVIDYFSQHPEFNKVWYHKPAQK